MVERKVYKTRLCLLYQKGRCSRLSCNFAHGDSELRRSFNGRQEYQDRDLRERLDRMRSPVRRYSPGRDARATHSSHGDSPRSIGKLTDRNPRKRQHLDGHENYSGNLRMSDGSEDHLRERRAASSDLKLRMDDKLRQINSEMKMLDNEKRQLEIYLGDKAQEAETLQLKIHKLEIQLSQEKEENKRITTKIKKFIKAHKRHLRLQEELKRSHYQLQKLGEQLDVDVMGPSNQDGSIINTTIDDETGLNFSSPLHESQMNSPRKKRSRSGLEAHDTSNRVNSSTGKIRLENSQFTERHDQLTNSVTHETDEDTDREDRSPAYEDRPRRGMNLYSDATVSDKYKVSEPAVTLPLTGMAAHAIDDDAEVNEMEEKFRVAGVASKSQHLPFPPPPPPPLSAQNVYQQYEINGEKVDISGPDEDTVEVDII